MLVYGIDEEIVNGIPENATKFLKTIHDADGIILSLAEHSGNFSAVFKNVYDWMSRIEQKLWNDIPMLVMATSPRGRASALAIAKSGFPHMGGNIISDFSLPSFYDNFKDNQVIGESKERLKEAVLLFQKAV